MKNIYKSHIESEVDLIQCFIGYTSEDHSYNSQNNDEILIIILLVILLYLFVSKTINLIIDDNSNT